LVSRAKSETDLAPVDGVRGLKDGNTFFLMLLMLMCGVDDGDGAAEACCG
jgi:hypothetical protein